MNSTKFAKRPTNAREALKKKRIEDEEAKSANDFKFSSDDTTSYTSTEYNDEIQILQFELANLKNIMKQDNERQKPSPELDRSIEQSIKLSEIEVREKQLRDEIEKIKENLEQQLNEIKQSADKTISNLKTVEDELNAKVNKLQNELNYRDKLENDYFEELNRIKTDKELWKKRCQEITATNEKLESCLLLKNEESKLHSEANKSMNDEICQLSKKYDKLKTKKKIIKSTLHHLQKTIQEKMGIIDNLERNQYNLQQDITKLKDVITEKDKLIAHQQFDSDLLMKKINEMTDKLEEFEKDKHILMQSLVKELSSSVENLKEYNTKLSQEKSDLDAELKQEIEKSEHLQVTIIELQKKLSETTARNQELIKELVISNESLIEREQTLVNLTEKLEKLNAIITDKDDEVEMLQNKLISKSNQANCLQQCLDELQNEFDKLKSLHCDEVTTNRQKMESLQHDLIGKSKELNRLNAIIDRYKNDLDNSKKIRNEELLANNTKFTTLNVEIEALQSGMDLMAKEKELVEMQGIELRSEIDELRCDNERKRQEIMQLKDESNVKQRELGKAIEVSNDLFSRLKVSCESEEMVLQHLTKLEIDYALMEERIFTLNTKMDQVRGIILDWSCEK